MERFWVFLEAVAGILAEQQSAETLKRNLSQMEPQQRERMNKYLQVISERLPHLMDER
jgi:hypothetical protein